MDPTCNIYIGGSTYGANVPTTQGQLAFAGQSDAVLLKMSHAGEWCGCPDGKPPKEFYREDGSQNAAHFLLTSGGGADGQVRALVVPASEAGGSDWYSQSGHMGDAKALADQAAQAGPPGGDSTATKPPPADMGGAAGPGSDGTGAGDGSPDGPDRGSSGATVPPMTAGYDNWSNTFLDPSVPPCPGATFVLTLDWS